MGQRVGRADLEDRAAAVGRRQPRAVPERDLEGALRDGVVQLAA
jgi:hypothetical protein